MKKIVATFLLLIISFGIISTTSVYASSNLNELVSGATAGNINVNGLVSGATKGNLNVNELISESTKSKLVEMKDKELKSLEDYKQAYGNDIYGLVGYILNKVRLYSIPIGFLLIAICAIYQFVVGARYLEARNKGFNGMIAVITLFVICQVLPLVFAIVIKGWRG